MTRIIKPIVSFLLLLAFTINTFLAFSLNEISENYLYFLDTDNNNKIDRLEIEFSSSLTGILNPDKLFLYSSTGGLSISKLDSVSGTSIFSSYSLSGNILLVNLIEQDNTNTWLQVNNTTSSHLRIKTNAGVWITDLLGNEIKLLYTSSFNNYVNASFKANPILTEESTEIVDDTSYEETINSETIPETSSGNLENTEEVQEEIDVNLDNSGRISNSDSGSILNETWTTQNQEINNFLYETKILFQSPSYVLELWDDEASIFNCDNSKIDCKVNYNLNIDFWSGFVSVPSTYECFWNFGFSGTIWEEAKCNPNTITYPIWEYETTYRIIEKANPSNYKEKKIIVKNTWYKDNITKVVYTTTTSQNINNPISINNPKIIIQSGLDENHNCSKTDCSINLNYETQNSKEACLWTFSGWEYEQESKYKCNPGYVKYPLWNFQVKLRVYELWNESNYKETFLDFTNKELVKEEIEANISSFDNLNTEISNSSEESDLEDARSFFTGSLEISQVLPNAIWNDDFEWFELKNNWINEINLNWCEIHNLLQSSTKKYKFKEDIILEVWDTSKFYKFNTNFAIRNSSGRSLELFCQDEKLDSLSWTFDTPEWFVVNKEILSKNIDSIKTLDEDDLFILNYVDWTEKELSKYTEFSLPVYKNVLSFNKDENIIDEIKSIIEVQWKIWDDKLLSRDKIICKNTDECSVNLDGRSSKWENLSFFWDFWNSKFFNKSNPAAYKFKTGKHIISLKVNSAKSEDISYFIVEVLWKESKIKKEKNEDVEIEDNTSDFIKVAKASNKDSDLQSWLDNKYLYIWLLILFSFILGAFIIKKRGIL